MHIGTISDANIIAHLWNASNRNVDPGVQTTFMNRKCPSMGSVASNHIELIYFALLNKIDNLVKIEPPPRRTKDSASLVVDVLNKIGRQLKGRVLLQVDKAIKSATNTVDGTFYSVQMDKRVGDFTHNVVETRAKAPTSYNGGIYR